MTLITPKIARSPGPLKPRAAMEIWHARQTGRFFSTLRHTGWANRVRDRPPNSKKFTPRVIVS